MEIYIAVVSNNKQYSFFDILNEINLAKNFLDKNCVKSNYIVALLA